MQKNRLEAFSDGVFAIIITIMVLELKIPHGDNWSSILPLYPKFLSYILSFIYIGIYWNNHHHLLHTVNKVSGGMLWANMHLLFWLSLVPFVTAWAGENYFTSLPVAFYAIVMLMSAIAYTILSKCIIQTHGKDESLLAKSIGRDAKGMFSIAFYIISIPTAFFQPFLSVSLLIAVAIMWLIPDKRIERNLKD
jgi:uncharacterized membrane protein